jgi:hypothetical protein
VEVVVESVLGLLIVLDLVSPVPLERLDVGTLEGLNRLTGLDGLGRAAGESVDPLDPVRLPAPLLTLGELVPLPVRLLPERTEDPRIGGAPANALPDSGPVMLVALVPEDNLIELDVEGWPDDVRDVLLDVPTPPIAELPAGRHGVGVAGPGGTATSPIGLGIVPVGLWLGPLCAPGLCPICVPGLVGEELVWAYTGPLTHSGMTSAATSHGLLAQIPS